MKLSSTHNWDLKKLFLYYWNVCSMEYLVLTKQSMPDNKSCQKTTTLAGQQPSLRTFYDKPCILPQYFDHLFNKHILIKICIQWVEKTSYLLVSELYMCTKSYSTRFLCFLLYFCIRLYRVLNFFLYEAVPPCDTQLPLHGKCRT